MKQSDTIEMFALNAIADDYENFDIVLRRVAELGAQCDMTVGRSEVLQALMSLIEAGLAKAYVLSGNAFEEFHGMPPDFALKGWDYAFWITEKGRQVALGHPVRDEEGSLRKDWPGPLN
ncbi:MAG TPA: hypothetical protein VET69_08770 [Terriglobales bacterium]|nr:hypothetical protein [Terriglobales bacterium]